MNIVFNCPHCNVEMTVDEAGVGESVACPTCSNDFVIPQGRPEDEVKAEKAAAAAPAAPEKPAATIAAPAAPGGSPAAAEKPKEPEKKKEEKKPKIPPGTDLAALLPNQKKPEEEAEAGGPGIRVKSFQHHLCIDMGKDLFDGMVAKFLKSVDKEDIISVSPISYSYKDSSGDIITDYGCMIVYYQQD